MIKPSLKKELFPHSYVEYTWLIYRKIRVRYIVKYISVTTPKVFVRFTMEVYHATRMNNKWFIQGMYNIYIVMRNKPSEYIDNYSYDAINVS